MTVTETVPPPPINFPSPPDPQGWIELSEDGETVYVPVEWWVRLAEYMVDVEAAERKYRQFREIYKRDTRSESDG